MPVVENHTELVPRPRLHTVHGRMTNVSPESTHLINPAIAPPKRLETHIHHQDHVGTGLTKSTRTTWLEKIFKCSKNIILTLSEDSWPPPTTMWLNPWSSPFKKFTEPHTLKTN